MAAVAGSREVAPAVGRPVGQARACIAAATAVQVSDCQAFPVLGEQLQHIVVGNDDQSIAELASLCCHHPGQQKPDCNSFR